MPQGGIIRLNTSDASLKVGFNHLISSEKLFYGVDVSGKTNNGILPLITKGDISPSTRVNGAIGLRELFGTDTTDINNNSSSTLDAWVVLKAGYEGASFKIFPNLMKNLGATLQ